MSDSRAGQVPVPSALPGGVRIWLRAEGAAAFTIATVLFASAGYSWLAFALLFFTPDLSLIGYTAGPRRGAVIYNVAHSYVGPLLVATVLYLSDRPVAVPLIWAAHIGFDRLLGYGLKLPTAFADTHLGRIGGARGSSRTSGQSS